MVVAVAVMCMVQVAGDEIVGVAAVPHRFVSAAVVVPVGGLVGTAGVRWSAGVGVRGRYGHRMFVEVALVRVVHVPFVQIVGVAFMQHGRVAAIGAVPVGMVGVNVVLRVCFGHDFDPLSKPLRQADAHPPGRQVVAGMVSSSRKDWLARIPEQKFCQVLGK